MVNRTKTRSRIPENSEVEFVRIPCVSGISEPSKGYLTQKLGGKVGIPRNGRSSPNDSGDSVLVATSLTDTHDQRLIRIDRQSGEINWNVEIHCGPKE